MNPNRGLRTIVALAIVLCITASLVAARGQDKNVGGLRVATIDLTRVRNEYTVLKAFKQEVDKRQEELGIQFQVWEQNPLLPEADQKTLGDLNIKEKAAAGGLSAAEKTNQSKLIEDSHRLNADYQRLQNTVIGAITPADDKQLQDYKTRIRSTEARANAAKTALQAEMQNKFTTLAAEAQKKVHETLKGLAKEKGFNLVLSSEIAPYAEYDCTDDVIKLMNK
jgi:Skp family chaperone for outer membrane proteins